MQPIYKYELFHTVLPSGARWGARLALMALITLLAAELSLAGGNKHKLSKDLESKKGGPHSATVDVIIQYNETPTDAHHRKVREKGGALKTKLNVIKGAHYSVPVESLEALADDPDVAYISPDRPTKGALDHVVRAVNADIALANGWNGTGIGVAVVDSGITLHDDLNTDQGAPASRVVYSQSFVPGDTSTADAYGHGTHVAGIIASNGHDSLSAYRGVYRGVAPEVNIINLRVLDGNGAGTDSAVIAAIQQAIALKDTYNIRVLNLSLGRPVYESYTLDPLCQAVEAAWQAGIVVVVAAGNSGRDNSLGTHGYATIASPGNDPYVITVGATNLHNSFSQASQTITSYSSKGPTLIDHVVKPDLAAPGNQVVSLIDPSGSLAAKYPTYDVFPCNSALTVCNSTMGNPNYFRLSGTSMATPVVSGAAALLLQQNPTMTPDQAKARLMKTAWKGFSRYVTEGDNRGNSYNLQHDVFAIGAGFVDVAAALLNTELAPATVGSAKSPAVSYDPLTRRVSLVPDPTSTWNTSLVWGTSVVWGTAVIDDATVGCAVVWGDSVVWGTSTDQGFSVVWGTSVVWGSSTMQALSDGDDGDSE